MLKVGMNVGTRIVPADTPEIPQTPAQQNTTEQTIAQAKPILADGGPMRSEAMMSSLALRIQLNKQLANQSMPVRDLSTPNPETLQQTEQIDHQVALKQGEVQQQIQIQATQLQAANFPLGPGAIMASPLMMVAAVIAILKQLGDAQKEQDTSSSSKIDLNSIRKLDP